jgi:sequestosome 1
MAEKNTSSFKVFLTKEGINDVRRFNLEHHTHLSIKRFKEELHNVFPILDAHDYTLAWKDSDGDLISISSTEELKTALNEHETEVLKLCVTLQDEVQGPYQKHSGVKCDGCQRGVKGFRYKCIECPNFDLCATCERKGCHPNHCMIRFSVSTSYKKGDFNELVFMSDGKQKFCISGVINTYNF